MLLIYYLFIIYKKFLQYLNAGAALTPFYVVFFPTFAGYSYTNLDYPIAFNTFASGSSIFLFLFYCAQRVLVYFGRYAGVSHATVPLSPIPHLPCEDEDGTDKPTAVSGFGLDPSHSLGSTHS